MNPVILPAMCWIAPLLFFYKDVFGMKKPRNVDIPLNKEYKLKLFYLGIGFFAEGSNFFFFFFFFFTFCAK